MFYTRFTGSRVRAGMAESLFLCFVVTAVDDEAGS